MGPEATDIWNAATALGAAEGPPQGAPPGVAHLARLLRFHNAAMGGGLSFAVEVAGDFTDGARAACDYFELANLAAVLGQLIDGNLDYDLAEDLNDAYYEASGENGGAQGSIETAFERKLALSPSDFG